MNRTKNLPVSKVSCAIDKKLQTWSCYLHDCLSSLDSSICFNPENTTNRNPSTVLTVHLAKPAMDILITPVFL